MDHTETEKWTGPYSFCNARKIAAYRNVPIVDYLAVFEFCSQMDCVGTTVWFNQALA